MKESSRLASRLLKICYGLAAAVLLIFAALIIGFILHDKTDGGLLKPQYDYVIAEKKIWRTEDMPVPEDFLNAESADFVESVQFAAAPSSQLSEQRVALVMELKDGTVRTENSTLVVRDAIINWELGTDSTPAALLGEDYADAVFCKPITDYQEAGTYSFDVQIGGHTYPFTLVVKDSVAPVAVLADSLSFSVNQKLTPDDFLKSCEDASAVTKTFSEEPDTSSVGTRQTTLILTDAAGNVTNLPVTYTVSGDDVAPVFSGIQDLQTIAGVAISYTHNVKAEDAVDGEISFTAEVSDDFNIKNEGEYTITYTAKDSAGNQAQKTAKLTVLSAKTDLTTIDREMYMLMGYAITDELFKDADENMTEKDRAWKCYRYVQDHMYFVDNNNEYDDLDVDWIYPAALAIRQKYGDCRNYYGFARLLYTCCGLENIMVYHPANYAGADRHWWNMVQIDGAWYHCDPTPRVGISNFFMKTDAWMDSYSAKNGNCFKRDKSLYPATPN